MRRAVCALVALLAVVYVVGSADAAGTGWHVVPAARLGVQVNGRPLAAAVNRSGTSVVAFSSAHALSVVRRTAHGSEFKTVGRLSVRWPFVIGLTALANGRFLLLYTTKQRLVARVLDARGRLRRQPHVLATGYRLSGSLLFPASQSEVVVESDASRAVAVWGVTDGSTQRVEGAILGRTGWSDSKVFYETKASARAPYRVLIASDHQDRFLVSLHGGNGDTTARMWGLARGSQQWKPVTPPQTLHGSQLARSNGATVASVNGSITAAWQDASAAVVVSTWNGSTWTTPVKAIAGSHSSGNPIAVYPVFVSDGSRAALVWMDSSGGFLGRVMVTTRSSPGARWSTPLAFPHSHGSYWRFALSTIDTFWFTASGAVAGIWTGDPITRDPSTGGTGIAGLYAGSVGAGGASATLLSRTGNGAAGHSWFALARAGDLHTILWTNGDGKQFSATVSRNGTVRQKQRLDLCAWPFGASNPASSAEVLIGGGAHLGNRLACAPVLLW